MNNNGVRIRVPERAVSDAQIVGFFILTFLSGVLITFFVLTYTAVNQLEEVMKDHQEQTRELINTTNRTKKWRKFAHELITEQGRHIRSLYFETQVRMPEQSPAWDQYVKFVTEEAIEEEEE
jgi:hypothetical protein